MHIAQAGLPRTVSSRIRCQMREMLGPSGATVDPIQAFRAHWTLDGTWRAKIQMLRSHLA